MSFRHGEAPRPALELRRLFFPRLSCGIAGVARRLALHLKRQFARLLFGLVPFPLCGGLSRLFGFAGLLLGFGSLADTSGFGLRRGASLALRTPPLNSRVVCARLSAEFFQNGFPRFASRALSIGETWFLESAHKLLSIDFGRAPGNIRRFLFFNVTDVCFIQIYASPDDVAQKVALAPAGVARRRTSRTLVAFFANRILKRLNGGLEPFAYFGGNGGKCRIIDRLHRCYGINRRNFGSPINFLDDHVAWKHRADLILGL